MNTLNDHIKDILDAFAAGVSICALVKVLPTMSALLSLAWLSIRIYDRIKYGPPTKD